jgi:3-deoxy-7-phosphoheptulonate synthase/chorismate mutase
MSAPSDPILDRLREQISSADRAIVGALNDRLKLVAEIKAHKEALGIDFFDPEREAAMLEDLAQANHGPLSKAGLRELLGLILDLTKREVEADET